METAKEQDKERTHRARPIDEVSKEEENEVQQLLLLTWNTYSPHPDGGDLLSKEQIHVIGREDHGPFCCLLEDLELHDDDALGEWGEISLTIKLVQWETKKTKKLKVDNVGRDTNACPKDKYKATLLASCNFTLWQDESNASLMNFNQKERYLASLCRDLWTSAGEPKHEYNNFAIEMGRSRHSHVRINDLIRTIANRTRNESDQIHSTDCFQTAYIKNCNCNDESASKVLLEGLVTLLDADCILIARGSHMEKLGWIPSGFFSLPSSGDLEERWYLHIPKH